MSIIISAWENENENESESGTQKGDTRDKHERMKGRLKNEKLFLRTENYKRIFQIEVNKDRN